MAIQNAADPVSAETHQVDLIKVDTALISLRASNFDTPAAVGELVDNGLQAGANVVRVAISETKREIGKRGKREGDNFVGRHGATSQRPRTRPRPRL